MKKIIHQIINAVIIFVMVFFSIPKFQGKEVSMKGFKQFEEAIHIDADFFRIFTAISEVGIALLIFIFALTGRKNAGKLGFGFLLITMISALGLELFARPEPKMFLVNIALALGLMAAYRLKTLQSK